MRGFFRNCKGAVTVFVTLLLIPAILVTGTGVDLARLYSARGAVRNANQLAANAALAGYDSLLKDLYGLFAVMQSDDELATALDVYIRASIFGEEITDAQMGELRLFWGSESVDVTAHGFDNLSNAKILRRQIEEYAKWRAPVAIVSDILDRISSDSFSSAAADSDAINDKTAIDEEMARILEKYQELYDKIGEINQKYNDLESAIFHNLNNYGNRIRTQMSALSNVRGEYEITDDFDRKNELNDHYNAIIQNIYEIIEGGNIGSFWIPEYDEFGSYIGGDWSSVTTINPGYRDAIESYVNQLRGFEAEFDSIITLSREIRAMKGEIESAISDLEAKLESDTLSDGLGDGIQLDLDLYKELLQYDFEPLCEDMKQQNMNYINNTVIPIIENIDGFGTVINNEVVYPSVSFSNLTSLGGINGFQIDYNIPIVPGGAPRYPTAAVGISEMLSAVGQFHRPDAFTEFQNCGTEHENAYKALEEATGINPTAAQQQEGENRQDNMYDLFGDISEIYEGLFDYDVSPGAEKYAPNADNRPDSFVTSPVRPTLDLGFGGFGGATGFRSTINMVSGFLSGNLSAMDILSDAMNDLSNRALLVTYSNNMFSNWTTEDNTVSMSGNPISHETNYFYKSELEYIFNGNSVASKNLQAVSFAIFAIRLISNLASTYIIGEVNAEIRAIQAAVSFIPFAGLWLRWLVRPLYVFGESVLDLADLRNGEAIVLTKLSSSSWRFWLSGFIAGGGGESSNPLALYYRDYLTIFLLAGNQNIITSRTANLIMLNVTNAKHSIAADEDRMANTKLFDLGKANTNFEITTSANVRFMFLSLNYAQGNEWVNARPPKTFAVNQTDYRGY